MTTLRLRRAFTLVEMLVVIGIISVLAALLLPAVMIAVRTARNASIAVEINQLASAIESYKQDKGDYPPNFRDSSVVLRHIRKCYPKADPTYVNNFVTYACNSSQNTFIDDGEALVFWLSMTDNDLRYPFLSYFNPNQQSPSPKKYYPFDDTQLDDLDATEAQSTNVGQFYDIRSCRGKYSKDSYYLYIDSRAYDDTCRFSGAPYSDAAGNRYAYAEDSAFGARPYWSATLATGAAANAPARSKYKPMNATTFQIICAGQDGDYGGSPTQTTDVKLFPSGLNYDLLGADKDNITNFSAGKTLSDSLP